MLFFVPGVQSAGDCGPPVLAPVEQVIHLEAALGKGAELRVSRYSQPLLEFPELVEGAVGAAVADGEFSLGHLLYPADKLNLFAASVRGRR